MEKSQATGAPRDPDVGWATTRRRGIRRVGVEGTIFIRRIVRKQESRLLENRAKASLIVRGRMNNITNQVVTGHTVTTAPTNKGVVASTDP